MTYAIQLALITKGSSSHKAGQGCVQSALRAYVFYNKKKLYFEVINSREQWYFVQSHQTCYSVSDCIVAPGDARAVVVAPTALECSDAEDMALPICNLSPPGSVCCTCCKEQPTVHVKRKRCWRFCKGDQAWAKKRDASIPVLGHASGSDESVERSFQLSSAAKKEY